MNNAPKPQSKRFLIGNFMSSYMPLAKPPERDLKRFALKPDQLAHRFHARSERRVSREKGYNRFRLVGSLIVMTLMVLGLYAGITAPDVEDETAQATTPSEITMSSFETGVSATTDIPALFR